MVDPGDRGKGRRAAALIFFKCEAPMPLRSDPPFHDIKILLLFLSSKLYLKNFHLFLLFRIVLYKELSLCLLQKHYCLRHFKRV